LASWSARGAASVSGSAWHERRIRGGHALTPHTQVAVLTPLGRTLGGASRRGVAAADRTRIRLVAFAGLGLYAVLQWGRLMHPAPTWRLLGLLALAVALAGVGPVLLDRERAVATRHGRTEAVSTLGAPLAFLAILALFPLAGVPVAWMVHLRVAVTADAIGQGLSALPSIYVPYSGINEWVQVSMLLGAGILLLDAALLLAFAPPALGDIRRAGAALPLVALVVVPAVSVHPHLAYLHGLVLFALLAFFIWGERVPSDRRGGVLLAGAAAGAIGMIVAPALDRHSPWVNTQALARGLTPAHVERFDWTQRYGPIDWPRTGNTVLEVKALPSAWAGEYWKAENLDQFDGTRWVAGGVRSGATPLVSQRTIARWTQTLTVTLRGMQTNQVIAAGTALVAPQHLTSAAVPGSSAGTYVTQGLLRPGDTYAVRVYAPHPDPARLARAGEAYPLEVLQGDLRLALPQQPASGRGAAQTVLFPAFDSGRPAPVDETDPTLSARAAVEGSPYGQAYQLARRLARAAPTPYAFVERVMNYLSGNGYSYDEFPPPTQYPLETFLFQNRIGYCQQFAGAAALLLRMGGVPARVATGFTTGAYDGATKRWLVSDVDAHAWVEAWFPHYGWVTFDPTPPAAPARGGRAAINSDSILGGSGGLSSLGVRRPDSAGAATTAAKRVHSSTSAAPILLGTLGVLVALLVLALVGWSRSGASDPDGILSELERALARSGRPVGEGVTLAALERRFRASPEAAAYVRALRMARFGGGTALPTLRQRRALRAQLRAGLGLSGALRALWALPPRRQRARWPRRREAK
jgi:transglutaminase-like putative cysteine protease